MSKSASPAKSTDYIDAEVAALRICVPAFEMVDNQQARRRMVEYLADRFLGAENPFKTIKVAMR